MGFFDNIDPNEISNDDDSVVITPSATVEDETEVEFEDADIIQDIDTIDEADIMKDYGLDDEEEIVSEPIKQEEEEEKEVKPTPTTPPPAPTKDIKPSANKGTVILGTVIFADTTVSGNITSSKDIYVEGRVEGNVSGENVTIEKSGFVVNDVTASETVIIEGIVTGNISGKTVDIRDCKIKGTITSDSDVIITEKAKIVGDITSANVTVNGAVRGNIICSGTATIGSSGAVKGNIKASEIVISKGARIQGSIERTGSEIDDSIFE